MKKKLLLSAVAGLALAACTTNEEWPADGGQTSSGTMNFDVPFVGKVSRATGNLNTGNITGQEIWLWGDEYESNAVTSGKSLTQDDETNPAMTAHYLKSTTTGSGVTWAAYVGDDVVNLPYNGKYTEFLALAPKSAINGTAAIKAEYVKKGDTDTDVEWNKENRLLTISNIPLVQVVEDGTPEGNDLLMAVAETYNDNVSLSFSHLLSRLRVGVWTDENTAEIKVINQEGSTGTGDDNADADQTATTGDGTTSTDDGNTSTTIPAKTKILLKSLSLWLPSDAATAKYVQIEHNGIQGIWTYGEEFKDAGTADALTVTGSTYRQVEIFNSTDGVEVPYASEPNKAHTGWGTDNAVARELTATKKYFIAPTTYKTPENLKQNAEKDVDDPNIDNINIYLDIEYVVTRDLGKTEENAETKYEIDSNDLNANVQREKVSLSKVLKRFRQGYDECLFLCLRADQLVAFSKTFETDDWKEDDPDNQESSMGWVVDQWKNENHDVNNGNE